MKKAGLGGVLSATAKREPPARVRTTADGGPRPKTPDRTYREGRYLIAGYFDASVKSSLRQIQVSHLKKTVQQPLRKPSTTFSPSTECRRWHRWPPSAADARQMSRDGLCPTLLAGPRGRCSR